MAKTRAESAPNITPFNPLSRTVVTIASKLNLRIKRPPITSETKGDAAWLWEIPCRRGRKTAGRHAHIYAHSSSLLGYTGRGSKILRELLTIPDVAAWQDGDDEFSVVFPDRAMDAVAAVVLPYARRKVVIPRSPADSEK